MSSSRLISRLRYLSTHVGPKAFPSPYNVGIDIARISRFETIILATQHHEQAVAASIALPGHPDGYQDSLSPVLRRFIRKVFAYCEWPRLELELKRYIEAPNDKEKLAKLARYLAGRWAVKEAAIKAHSYRRLHYRDAIVLYRKDLPDLHLNSEANAPVVLINPPKPEVYMTDAVAHQRGLWRSGGISLDTASKPYRLAKTAMHERQIARAAISHDGDYVTAIVYALDESDVGQNLHPIIDDGHGDPIHEPLIGDTIH